MGIWLSELNLSSLGESVALHINGRNIFRGCLCQHWNFTSLCSLGNRRKLLRHSHVLWCDFSPKKKKKARASVICDMWSSFNVGELWQLSAKPPLNFIQFQEREPCHLFTLWAFWLKRKYSVTLCKSLKYFLKTCSSSLCRERRTHCYRLLRCD